MRLKCTNVCLKYGKRAHTGRGLYLNGRKFCRFCGVSMKYNVDICPCCKCLLKTRGRKAEKPIARLNVVAMLRSAMKRPDTTTAGGHV